MRGSHLCREGKLRIGEPLSQTLVRQQQLDAAGLEFEGQPVKAPTSFPGEGGDGPLTVAYKVLEKAVDLGLGIDLAYTVKLGRRVRLWHHGGMVLGARSIGDDVHIRQNTTMGVLSRDELRAKPTIEDRVDIGAGACILGNVTVGHDTVIGANTVVVKDEPPHSTLFGIPARPVKLS